MTPSFWTVVYVSVMIIQFVNLTELSLHFIYSLSNLRHIATVEDLPFHFIYSHSLRKNKTQ